LSNWALNQLKHSRAAFTNWLTTTTMSQSMSKNISVTRSKNIIGGELTCGLRRKTTRLNPSITLCSCTLKTKPPSTPSCVKSSRSWKCISWSKWGLLRCFRIYWILRKYWLDTTVFVTLCLCSSTSMNNCQQTWSTLNKWSTTHRSMSMIPNAFMTMLNSLIYSMKI